MFSAQYADQGAYAEWRKVGVSWCQQWRKQWRKQSAILLGGRESWLSSNTNESWLVSACLPTFKRVFAMLLQAAARRKLGVSSA